MTWFNETKVIEAGKEFGLPVGINGTTDFKERYAQGVRLFFDIGPAYAGSGPRVTAEERKAVGRQATARRST